MTPATRPGIDWVILTTGNRPSELGAAIDSLRADSDAPVIVVGNGADVDLRDRDASVIVELLDENVGIPAGRHVGAGVSTAGVIGFLDDDAALTTQGVADRIAAAFASDPTLGAVTFRIAADDGATSRRHNPRVGHVGLERPGDVPTFLGGACAIRRSAYEEAGGYWRELFYAHEELDLAWRLRDAGYTIGYLPDIVVRHPAVEISRHARGWHLTGRNRVMIARRNLPWPIALVHTVTWLLLGLHRAPDTACRRSYASGWRTGWRVPVRHSPMSWRTIAALTRLGRPPVI